MASYPNIFAQRLGMTPFGPGGFTPPGAQPAAPPNGFMGNQFQRPPLPAPNPFAGTGTPAPLVPPMQRPMPVTGIPQQPYPQQPQGLYPAQPQQGPVANSMAARFLPQMRGY